MHTACRLGKYTSQRRCSEEVGFPFTEKFEEASIIRQAADHEDLTYFVILSVLGWLRLLICYSAIIARTASCARSKSGEIRRPDSNAARESAFRPPFSSA